MKFKCGNIWIIGCIIAITVIYSVSFGDDDRNFRVIEIGGTDGTPISGPIKWSPSGNKLGFISRSHIFVVDTLGNEIATVKSNQPLHRFEWLTDKEIVAFEDLRSRMIEHIKLVKYDIETGESKVIQEFKKDLPLPRGLNDGYFEGPYLTVQGNLYYYLYEGGVKTPTFPESKYSAKARSRNNYIYKLTSGGLYLMRADLQDSIYAYDKNYKDTVQSLKQKYYVRGGFITDLKDSTSILLDTFPVLENIKADYIGCGFMNEDINPKYKEILFYYTCDIDEYNSTGYLFLFDIDSGTFIDLAHEMNEENCQTGRFSPDGKMIALCCSGKGYIFIRGE